MRKPHKPTCDCDICRQWAESEVAAEPTNPNAVAWCILWSACRTAILWIHKNKIRTMDEAWWKCENPDWLWFIVDRRHRLSYISFYPLFDRYYDASPATIRRLFRPKGSRGPRK